MSTLKSTDGREHDKSVAPSIGYVKVSTVLFLSLYSEGWNTSASLHIISYKSKKVVRSSRLYYQCS
jgi:hypothetical protein